ncbi:MAG: cytosine methyltransferase [Alteromonas sp.]|nr:cytosine methyltransferase [Alteromonas sp.]MAY23507.1 cytosine methyltransferase [Flavobacteriaceae bacterium]|tara:strand:+ start:19627 stop:19992 length:366 start_codon:yes stop_codon:yes gene_type:complete
MSEKKRHNPKRTKGFRKELRSNLTSAEAYLWGYLKEKRLGGRKFRRQHGIGPYVVDFYCASEQIVIELEGEVHMNATAEEQDLIRMNFLESEGLTVLRFENKMVFENLFSVLNEIKDHYKV